jgi:hypothetical protein
MARSTEAIVEPSILGELDGRCKKQGCLLTVYFDDVTLSGETLSGMFASSSTARARATTKKSTMSAARSKSPASLSPAESSRRTANF